MTSPGLIFEAVQGRRGLAERPSWILDQAVPRGRAAPMVTVLDGHPHTLAFLADDQPRASESLGVSKFGQVGSLEDGLPLPRNRHRQHRVLRAGPAQLSRA